MVVSWAAGAATDGSYEVWSSEQPYFLPGDQGATSTVLEEPPYRDLGAASAARYYSVLGKDLSGQVICASSRQGTFGFGLMNAELWQ